MSRFLAGSSVRNFVETNDQLHAIIHKITQNVVGYNSYKQLIRQQLLLHKLNVDVHLILIFMLHMLQSCLNFN